KRRNSLSLAEAFQSRRRSPWCARVVLRDSPTKLPLTPVTVRFGAGEDWVLRMARAVGLIRFAGIWLPGKGRPVRGSRTVRPMVERSPLRQATGATEAVCDPVWSRIVPWAVMKKNALIL